MQAEKHFLRYFLRGSPVAQEMERDGKHGGLMPQHQRPEIATGFHRLGQHGLFFILRKSDLEAVKQSNISLEFCFKVRKLDS
jgi:hypothetical protein